MTDAAALPLNTASRTARSQEIRSGGDHKHPEVDLAGAVIRRAITDYLTRGHYECYLFLTGHRATAKIWFELADLPYFSGSPEELTHKLHHWRES